MRYKFDYNVTATDLWKLSMYGTYHSIAGLCNVLFTVAMIVLTGRFFGTVSDFLSMLMIFGCVWFPLIEPALVYQRARSQALGFPKGMEMGFDDGGIHIRTVGKKSDLKWKDIRHVIQKANMVILSSGNAQGYLLTNRVLGNQKDDFLAYVKNMVKVQSKGIQA